MRKLIALRKKEKEQENKRSIKMEEKEKSKEYIHFTKVCMHGVQHGYTCRSCKKVISIPEDAVIQLKEEDKIFKNQIGSTLDSYRNDKVDRVDKKG